MGVNISAQGDVNIGGDVVKGDKTTQNIEHYHADAGPRAPHQLPAPPQDFTGRTSELTELLQAV